MPDGSLTKDTSPASFEEALRGHPDASWGVATNFRRINKRDRVWVYYGRADGDLGVVGLATVREVTEQEDGRTTVLLRWDIERSKHLIVRPFPATEIRRAVWPRAAVGDLTPHARLVARLLRHASLPGIPSAPPSGAHKRSASTITYTPPKSVKAYLRHDAMIHPVRTRLETCGWELVEFRVPPKRVDLAMAKGKQVLLMEFKTITGSTARPVRDAFSQLHEYVWRYRRLHHTDSKRIHMWAIFERQPSDADVAFLEDSSLLVSWPSKPARRLLHSRHTHDRLRALGVVT